jgi:hypothetical protein
VWPRILERLEMAKKSRLGIIPAYLSILTHQAEHPGDALELVTPWCLGQHFMTRLCANAGFKKLLLKAEALDLQDVINKYHLLNQCIDQALEQGNQDKNEEKIMSDFYLVDFDPVINFNLSDIFHHFPRLMGLNDVIPDDVWSNDNCLKKIPIQDNSSFLNKHRVRFCR